ncbi:transposase [Pedobacter sp. W3I1]|uniref:IS110 family transposase n=1 Tax=Pedobacter sp. W3I1 TaxID=3042291 RepID=UPI00278A9B8B|nr:IS110 family transposase [Pedobacter sp. W3I1]MDQ0637281.1 transposase [Pedobacter sp. W3I1]MDQ0637777.1 transposase [Pedobacter sp. W3I1]MDQ0640346.1 transposase [Pedobacter sp. W3I1]MDQ0640638.1 transposase [Pedobacter sp. W3I1]MDQ0640971.1 transposase [Pedobacter sp. W3I1]
MIGTTKFFIGIDVSKPYFDVALMAVVNHVKQEIATARFDNTAPGIKLFEKWLKSQKTTFNEDSLIVIENTGIYHRLIWTFCSNRNLPIHIGNAAHIKWSFGIARGKNDKIDSIRLCNYAFKEADDLKATAALDPELMLLKDLISARTKLLKQRSGISVSVKELGNVNGKEHQKLIEKALKNAIEGIAKSIKNLEDQIKKIITGNQDFKQNYKLLLSIPGIGHVTAVYLIGCTGNFAGRPSGKELACYAGVAPFEHSSGISIKGKSKVHRMANKELKRLLHMCALSLIQHNQEFKTYYNRKKDEGKHSMSIINAVRNKIALRVAAVIKNQASYKNNYNIAA